MLQSHPLLHYRKIFPCFCFIVLGLPELEGCKEVLQRVESEVRFKTVIIPKGICPLKRLSSNITISEETKKENGSNKPFTVIGYAFPVCTNDNLAMKLAEHQAQK